MTEWMGTSFFDCFAVLYRERAGDVFAVLYAADVAAPEGALLLAVLVLVCAKIFCDSRDRSSFKQEMWERFCRIGLKKEFCVVE